MWALNQANKPLHWTEWEVSDEDAPDYAHQYGSPTILIDGEDFTGEPATGNPASCRIYTDENGRKSGVPNRNDLVKALLETSNPRQKIRSWKLNGTIVPVIGIAFVPKLFCPACWPAYAGLLSALGIGFIDYTPYLLPLTLVFVVLALGSLLYKAKSRHGYLPFYLGSISSLGLIIGKFYFESDFSMYLGLGALILASVWNTWPVKSRESDGICSACTTANH